METHKVMGVEQGETSGNSGTGFLGQFPDRQWSWLADMNGDGAVTISDVGTWVSWIFYYPGDFLLAVIMVLIPDVGIFFEVTPDAFGGWFSSLVSSVVWLMALVTGVMFFFRGGI